MQARFGSSVQVQGFGDTGELYSARARLRDQQGLCYIIAMSRNEACGLDQPDTWPRAFQIRADLQRRSQACSMRQREPRGEKVRTCL